MDCFLVEDWITLKGDPSNPVIQSEPRWLDLQAYREIVAWLDVREFSSSANVGVGLQTAPTKDETLFTSMANFNPLVTGVSTKLLTPDVLVSPYTPLARWVRWSVAFSVNPGDITFRLWIAANQPGRHAQASPAMRR